MKSIVLASLVLASSFSAFASEKACSVGADTVSFSGELPQSVELNGSSLDKLMDTYNSSLELSGRVYGNTHVQVEISLDSSKVIVRDLEAGVSASTALSNCR